MPKVSYTFRIPNLPRTLYDYLKMVRNNTGLSAWQVVILALLTLQAKGVEDHEGTLALVEKVRREFPAP